MKIRKQLVLEHLRLAKICANLADVGGTSAHTQNLIHFPFPLPCVLLLAGVCTCIVASEDRQHGYEVQLSPYSKVYREVVCPYSVCHSLLYTNTSLEGKVLVILMSLSR